MSVDMNGDPFSAMDYIAERLSRFDAQPPDGFDDLLGVDREEATFLNGTNSLDSLSVIELPSNVNDGINAIWAYMWFLGSQSKDLGTWIGVSTAPFHYMIAISIALVTLFTNQFMMVIAFFYLLITEFDEFKNIRKKDVI